MSIEQLLSELPAHGIHLWLEDGKLKFRAPASGLPEHYRRQIVAQRDAIVALLKQGRGVDEDGPRPLGRDRPLPLSFEQERLWFLHQLFDELALFNMIHAFEWQGEVDQAALASAIRQVIERHEILRTRIDVIEGVPFQRPAATLRWQLVVEEHAGLDPAGRQAVCRQVYRQEQSTGFDVAAGEVIRTRLLRFDGGAVLFFSLHHIASDAWSHQILLAELSRFYLAAVDRRPCTLAPLAVQYADYAAWQRQRLASGELQASIDFWRGRLDESTFQTRLPPDRPRPANKSFRGQTVAYALRPELQHGLKTLRERHGLTPSNVMLAAYALLVARYTRRQTVSFGIPTAGRERSELQALIGFFVNAIVCRIDIPESGSALAYVQSVQQGLLQALEHQQVPIECLAAIMNQARGTAEHLDMPMAFNFVEDGGEQGAEGPGIGGLPVTPLSLGSDEVAAKHEVTLYLSSAAAGIGGYLEYNADLYSRESMEAFLEHYDKLLARLVQDCEQDLRGLSWYDDADVLAWLQATHPQALRAFPLSPMQRDIYFSALLHPATTRNNLGCSSPIYQPIDLARWEAATRRLVAGDDMLRMRLHRFRDGRIHDVYQWVGTEAEAAYEFHDWSDGPAREPEALQRFIAAWTDRPFDLENGPLYRLALLRLASDHHVVVIAAHHVLFDGAAVVLLAKRLAQAYLEQGEVDAPRRGTEVFQAYVAAMTASMDTREVMDFWREKLAGVQALPVPPRAPAAVLRTQTRPFDQALWNGVKQYCRAQGITPAIFCKGLYGLLIGYYFQAQADFQIAEFSLGRTEAQLDDLGCYYRQQPFVFAHEILEGGRSFAEFWAYHKQFQRACKPFTALSAQAQARLAPAQEVAFMYNYNGYIKPIDILYGSGPDDQKGYIPQIEDAVQLYMKNVAEEMQANLVYPDGSFADDRLLDRFFSLARQLCQGDCPSLGAVDFLLPDEQRQLAEWEGRCSPAAAGAAPARRAPDVLGLFARQCLEDGDGIALRDADGAMSYAELDAQSSALARHLQRHHLKPGDAVALLLPRDRRFAIAMLAAAKASACYVPLDPEHPAKRIDYILDDAAVAVVITCEAQRGLIDPRRYPSLAWEGLAEVLAEAPSDLAAQPLAPADPDRILYVIYTSGTTGNPKGVQVSAGNLASLFDGCGGLFEVGAADCWSVCHSFAFDFSVWELWGALISGGCACIVDAATIKDAPRFLDWLQASRISVLSQTPSAFLALALAERQAAEQAGDSLPDLRYVVFGGEALDIQSLHGWRARHPLGRPALVNMYGITEITVHATFHLITEADFASGRNTIGKALPHLLTVLLDPCLRRVPPGFPGELFIAGGGVAQGYLRREALSAERFLQLPALGHAGARFYRTGDRARYLADGNLAYLGRNDRQVKIRGYRIELDEIENVLRACTGVSAAAVDVVEYGEPVGKRVVAWVCGASGTDALDPQLQERLPHYMVPANIVVLPQLPLTANGKVDYRALPRPDLLAAPEEAAELATPTQMRLAEIVGELLQQRVQSRTSNFFALGGHSLLATQLVSRIEQQFGIELPLRLVFQHARLDELAALIDRQLGQAAAPAESAIPPCPRDLPLPLSFAQQRLWFLYHVAPQDPFYNLPGVLQFKELDVAALEQTLLHVIARHEVFRTNFVLDEQGRPQVVVHQVPADWRLETLDLAGLPAPARRQRLEAETHANAVTPFVLERDLLLRCKLLDLGDRHVLLLATHHIVADGWSLEVLKREMAQLYEAFRQGRPSPLPPLPIQYTDFAHWQRQWLSGERLQAHLDYWRHQFDGVEQLDFPLDRVRPAQLGYRGDYVPMHLAPEVSERLRALARDQEATLFMVSLAALYVLLARYAGQRDLCVGTPIANRNHASTEALVGFFVNTIALRVQVDPAATFTGFVQAVKRVALDAYEHQDLPFELLVDHLNIERDPSRNPLFQIMFVLQNVPKNVAASDADGPAGELLDAGRKSAIFDLRVELFDNSEDLSGGIEFNVDLFDRSTIEAFASAYLHLVQQIVAEPGRGIMEYALLDAAAARQQVEDFNDTAAVLEDAACLHHLVERQCRATPDRIALRFGDRSMSYRQLDAASDQVACRLQALGVTDGRLVGVAMDRSLEMAVGLLAILKAGGAYVPIDPEYPANRCRYMVEDTALEVVLTQPHYRDWPVLAGVAHVLPMADGHLTQAGAGQAQARPRSEAGADSPCYVIYTSGSTGRPKGVVNVHRALVNRIAWMQAQYALKDDDVVLQKTPYSFDVSVWEFFWPLSYGATLVIASPGGHRDPDYLAGLVAREAVTTLHFVPSMLQAFLRLADTSSCTSLRRVICSGEALGKPLEQQCKARLPHADLHNLYGPTEAAIDVSAWTCDGADDRRALPIGRPISNCKLFVLDEHGAMLPRGAVGELHIGGVGLARAYLNLPDMTRERFIDSDRLGMRLYKTGDKARHRFDGALEYYGRIDHQVKIRGLRIEQGEIESVLMRVGGLASAAVTVWEDKGAAPDGGDDKLLVAYVVPSDQALASTTLAEGASLAADKVEQWGDVFDGIYAGAGEDTRPEFNIVGWNSSYTGLPVDPREMEDWVANTVARIRAVSGPRVLEVGCGTGLLLFRLAPACRRYVATDISARALAGLRARLAQDPDLAHVQTLQAAAEECAGLLAEPFDTIVMNSVVQYFPSAAYAEQVLQALVERIPAEGGTLFIGDVRHVALLRAFHSSVVCAAATPRQTVASLRREIGESIRQESELLLDPAFFHDFCRRHPRAIHCLVLLKREDHDNEMANFRYDVVLTVGAEGARPAAAQAARPCHRAWSHALDSIASLETLAPDRAYVISGVPNRRLQAHVELAETIFADDAEPRAELAALRAGVVPAEGPPLGAFWDWAERSGWHLEMAPGRSDLRNVDLLLVGPDAAGRPRPSLTAWQLADAGPQASQAIQANQPMQDKVERLLVQGLRDRLGSELPAYMVPQQFIVLEKLPLTASGKLDRKALPAPRTANQLAHGHGSHVAPRTALERQMAQLWCGLLKLDKVSMTADFFTLGGHSLLAVELIAQVKKLTGQHLQLISIFNHRTLDAFCRCVEAQGQAAQAPAPQFGVAVPLSERQDAAPLFCIHPGTGDALSYRALAAQLGARASVWGIQAPGYEAGTDDPDAVQHAPLALEEHGSFTRLAAHYCQVIRKIQPQGPYRILGWSSGGLLALDIARQLQEQGEGLDFLGMVDTEVPDPARHDYRLDDLAYLADGSPATVQAHPLYPLLDGLGLSNLSSAAQMNHLIRVTKYLRGLEGRHAPVMPSGPVHLFVAADEPSAQERGASLCAGWRGVGANDLRTHSMPGTHFTMLDGQHAAGFATMLAGLLA